jgi:hypothetical protein
MDNVTKLKSRAYDLIVLIEKAKHDLSVVCKELDKIDKINKEQKPAEQGE